MALLIAIVIMVVIIAATSLVAMGFFLIVIIGAMLVGGSYIELVALKGLNKSGWKLASKALQVFAQELKFTCISAVIGGALGAVAILEVSMYVLVGGSPSMQPDLASWSLIISSSVGLFASLGFMCDINFVRKHEGALEIIPRRLFWIFYDPEKDAKPRWNE
jgi:hypothetical protein